MYRVRNDAEETCLTTTIERGSPHGYSTTLKNENRGQKDSEPVLSLWNEKLGPAAVSSGESSDVNEKDKTTSPASPGTIIAEEPPSDRLSDRSNDDDDFPEGGLRAWLVVFGSFCAMFIVFGIVNSTAAFQEYFSSNQLRDYSPGQIGWIFSLNLFLVFFCGIHIGPIFDAHGPRVLVAVGSLAMVLSMMLLGFCTSSYPHFNST